MPRLTEVQRGQAIALLMQGQRQQVALQFGVNVSSIERLVRRLRDTGRVADRPRRGRQRITTPRQDRAIYLAHLCNRHVTATETALTTVGNHNHHIHPKTVRKRLREFGLRARRPYIDFPLTHTCEPSGGSIFLPILRVPSVPPVNFQNLPPVKKIKSKKILTYILRSIFLEFPIWNFRAEEKRREIRMVKVNVIFNDIRLLICLTPLQVNWVMVIN